jgi:hypothetical protein
MAGLGGVGQQMGGAGANYARMATDPGSIQSYMNPYLMASLSPQLQLANQQYGIAGQQGQSKAAQQGAFGGSREALQSAQNAQNQMLAQNQLIGQGYNRAFDTAQQAQQFGANLDLQGLQGQLAALQGYMGGANQLAGIGGSQLAAQQGIANMQNTYGQQQQQNQQNIINQAVQNYATAQQYPFMQLGLMNSMLRGLPMQQSSTQMYQAPPSALATLGGIGAAGKAAGVFKKGGMIKASSGIPMSHFSTPQLQQVTQSPRATPLQKVVAMGDLGMRNYITSNPEAKQVFAKPPQPQLPPPQQMAMAPQTREGLGAIGTGEMTQMADGGIIAFARGEAVKPDPEYQARLDAIANADVPDNTETRGTGRFASLPKEKDIPYNPRAGQYGNTKPSNTAMNPDKVLGSNASASKADVAFPSYLPKDTFSGLNPSVNLMPSKEQIKEGTDQTAGKKVAQGAPKDELHDLIMSILGDARKQQGSASAAIKDDIQAQRDAIEARNKKAESDKWWSVSAAMLGNTSPFWQSALSSGISAYNKTDSEIDKQNATALKDIITEKGHAQEMDDNANTRLIGVGMNALVANDNAKLRAQLAQNDKNRLQDDREFKHTDMAVRTFEKLRKDYVDGLVASSKVNMDEINKPEVLAASYKYASDALKGTKLAGYLGNVYTDTDTYAKNMAGVQNPAPFSLSPGTEKDGYIYKGGNPNDINSWAKKGK